MSDREVVERIKANSGYDIKETPVNNAVSEYHEYPLTIDPTINSLYGKTGVPPGIIPPFGATSITTQGRIKVKEVGNLIYADIDSVFIESKIKTQIPTELSNDNYKGYKEVNSCNICGIVSKTLWRCKKCLEIYYCNRNCQKLDWKKRKLICQSKTK